MLTGLSRTICGVGLTIAKHSPAIMLTAGVACVVAGAVLACKQTLHAEEILNKRDEELKKIDEAVEEQQKTGDGSYNSEMLKRDKALVTARFIGRTAKHYWLPITCLVIGVILLVSSHVVMAKRYAALASAYTALQTAFLSEVNAERKIMTDDKGEQYMGTIQKSPVLRDQKGRALPGPYSAWIDDDSYKYSRESLDNTVFNIENIEAMCQRMLDRRGYLFLSEAFNLLEIPPTDTSLVVGWTKDGSGKVDFGIDQYKDYFGQTYIDISEQLKNGERPPILLDFNCDGLIYGALPINERSLETTFYNGKTYPNPAAELEKSMSPEEYDDMVKAEMGEV